jgi:hypothetical protein
VALCGPDKKLVVPESVCGRPLGLQFHRRSGELYVADAYLGLLRVPARGGLAEVVAAEAGGEPFNFLNGLDVDQRTGDVYFTDSSTTYQRRYEHTARFVFNSIFNRRKPSIFVLRLMLAANICLKKRKHAHVCVYIYIISFIYTRV